MKELLKTFPLFSGFDEASLDAVIPYFSLKKFEKGEVILSQREAARTLYLIARGKVAGMVKLPGSIERKKGEYHPGDFFGEISLLGDRTAVHSYAAAEPSEVLTLRDEDLRLLIEKSPDVAVPLLSRLLALTIQRLRKSSSFLADVVQWGELASRRVITDELTGVYNRAFLQDALENFFNISQSNSKPLSLLMVDIDNCRRINEGPGHDAGNLIIIEVAELMKKHVSQYGILARYGGDEFSILLPEAGLERARAIAEEIRSEVEAHDFSAHLRGHAIAVTTSIGVSCYPETATDLPSFREKADASLYRAKELGRNRVAAVE